MGRIHINTNNPQDVPLKKGQDDLDITVDKSCNWCFLDPNYVFGKPSKLLPDGTYNKTSPPTTYGPYTPVKDGIVYFNAVNVGKTCNPHGRPRTGHTITVTG